MIPRDSRPPAKNLSLVNISNKSGKDLLWVYMAPKYNNDEEDEEVVNARIQQLHIERQKAQRTSSHGMNGQQTQQQQQPQPQQQLPPNVIYQSPNYNQNPTVHSVQSQPRPQFEQQQYYVMDEPIVKPTTTSVRSPATNTTATDRSPTKNSVTIGHRFQHRQQIPPQEHLYVNQKQLFNQNPNQYYEPIESHQRFVIYSNVSDVVI